MNGNGVNRGMTVRRLLPVPGCDNLVPFRYSDDEYEAVHLRRGGLWCDDPDNCSRIHPVDWTATTLDAIRRPHQNRIDYNAPRRRGYPL
jgi:hypothetical protein